MAKPSYEGPADALALYEALVATNSNVDRNGAKNPYTSRNGHMFTFLGADGVLALRLPVDRRDAFMAEYKTEPVISHNTVMKEYVAVPAKLLADTDALKPWFDESHDWIGTRKPKATTRKKTK